MREFPRVLSVIGAGLCLSLAGVPAASEPVLDADRTIDKSVVHPGEPVEVTLTLTGDHEAQCAQTALAVVLDVSGSLANWHGQLAAAVIGSLHYLDFQSDMMAVATFAGGYSVLQGWQNSSAASVTAALTSVQTGGSTNIPNAFRETNKLLQSAPGNPDCRAAIFVTDGQDSCPSPAEMALAGTNGWKYGFLGVGNQNAQTLTCMETGTGGTYYDSTQPPFATSILGAIRAIVDDFVREAMELVAPSDIVVKEAVTGDVAVAATEAPTAPPGQIDPAAFAQAAAPAWAALATGGAATLPSIDRLAIGPNGAKTEYSLHYTVTVNACDPVKTTYARIDAPGAAIAYDLPGIGARSVTANPIGIAIHPCSVALDKSWEAEHRLVRMTFTNHYPYSAEGFDVLEVVNRPLRIGRTRPAPVSGGAGSSYARFALPPLAPGASHEITLAIGLASPLPPGGPPFPVNDTTDSNFSFVVPWYAATITPATTDHAVLQQAIQAGTVTPAARDVLEKAAFAVPHARNTETVPGTPIRQAPATPWPGFDWRIEGTTGDFLIRSEGASYAIHVAHRQWNYDIPSLPVARSELNR